LAPPANAAPPNAAPNTPPPSLHESRSLAVLLTCGRPRNWPPRPLGVTAGLPLRADSGLLRNSMDEPHGRANCAAAASWREASSASAARRRADFGRDASAPELTGVLAPDVADRSVPPPPRAQCRAGGMMLVSDASDAGLAFLCMCGDAIRQDQCAKGRYQRTQDEAAGKASAKSAQGAQGKLKNTTHLQWRANV